MSLAKKYNALLKSQLLHYAAWHPLTDNYAVGDFGGFRRGVFQKLGNIREFGIEPTSSVGASATGFDFASTGAVVMRTIAGAEVDVFPEESMEAKLELEFRGEQGFYVRTKSLSVTELDSVDAIASRLRGRRSQDGRRWRLAWRVIRKVYVADDPVILGSAERGARFSLTGEASALRHLELGGGSLGISVTSQKATSLKVTGGRGPVALDLFRLRVFGGSRLESMGQRAAENTDESQGELDDAWASEPEDDPADLFE